MSFTVRCTETRKLFAIVRVPTIVPCTTMEEMCSGEKKVHIHAYSICTASKASLDFTISKPDICDIVSIRAVTSWPQPAKATQQLHQIQVGANRFVPGTSMSQFFPTLPRSRTAQS